MKSWELLGIKPTANREELKAAYEEKLRAGNLSAESKSQVIQAYSQALEDIQTFEYEEASYGKSPSLIKAEIIYQNSSWTAAKSGQESPESRQEENYGKLEPRQDYSQAQKEKPHSIWPYLIIPLVFIFAVYKIAQMVDYSARLKEREEQARQINEVWRNQQAMNDAGISDSRLAKQVADKYLRQLNPYVLEDAGDGTQTLKSGSEVIKTGITRAVELENKEYYLETNDNAVWMTGIREMLPGRPSIFKAFPAWTRKDAAAAPSERPNAVAFFLNDGRCMLVEAKEQKPDPDVYEVAGSPNIKDDKTVDIYGEPGSYSFAP